MCSGHGATTTFRLRETEYTLWCVKKPGEEFGMGQDKTDRPVKPVDALVVGGDGEPANVLVVGGDGQYMLDPLPKVKRAIRSIGVEVRLARGLHQALSYIAEKVPDCVVIDVTLPPYDQSSVMGVVFTHESARGKSETQVTPFLLLEQGRPSKEVSDMFHGTRLAVAQRDDFNEIRRVVEEMLGSKA
jgi:PleD family two-component response regulator